MHLDDEMERPEQEFELVEISEWELQERFDEWLDESYGSVSIAGFDYSTADTLKVTDPIAYRCIYNDWLDAEINEGVYREEGGLYYLV